MKRTKELGPLGQFEEATKQLIQRGFDYQQIKHRLRALYFEAAMKRCKDDISKAAIELGESKADTNRVDKDERIIRALGKSGSGS